MNEPNSYSQEAEDFREEHDGQENNQDCNFQVCFFIYS